MGAQLKTDDRGFLPIVTPRPHQAKDAIIEGNYKVQILFVSSPESVLLDLGRASLLTPTSIALQFQWVRGLGDRSNSACRLVGAQL